MNEEMLLLEVKKLISILNTFGNVLVPNIDDKETSAQERLQYIVNKLKEEYNLNIVEIESKISKL